MKDDEMLKKWLSNKEEKAFDNGVKFASEKIFNLCNAMSMPVCLSMGDDTFYVSIEDIKTIMKDIGLHPAVKEKDEYEFER